MRAAISATVDLSQDSKVSFQVIRLSEESRYHTIGGQDFFKDQGNYRQFGQLVESIVYGDAIHRQLLADMQDIVDRAAKLDPSLGILIDGYSIVRYGKGATEVSTLSIYPFLRRDLAPHVGS